MTTGFPVSPLTPATFLLVGLANVDLADHQRRTIPYAFAVTLLMTLAALATGATLTNSDNFAPGRDHSVEDREPAGAAHACRAILGSRELDGESRTPVRPLGAPTPDLIDRASSSRCRWCSADRAAGRRRRRRSSRGRRAPARAATRPGRSSSGRRCAPARSTFSSHSRSIRCVVVGQPSIASAWRSRTSCTWRSQLSIRPSDDREVRRPHAAAAVVAADDDVLHLQHVDGVLQHRQAIEVGVDDHVGDVAMDEQLAGHAARRSRWPARGCPSSRSTGSWAPAERRATGRSRGRARRSAGPTADCSRKGAKGLACGLFHLSQERGSRGATALRPGTNL